MKQSDLFIMGEAEQWIARNKNADRTNDPVINMMRKHLSPEMVLEIGAGDGWRLKRVKQEFESSIIGCSGLDPVNGYVASAVPWEDDIFDLVIYGFCLYVCDPEDYLKIASEGDRVLKDGGHIIIHDFNNFFPFKRPYEHCKGVYSHHFQFERLWLSSPVYHVIDRMVVANGEQAVILLRKDISAAFTVRP